MNRVRTALLSALLLLLAPVVPAAAQSVGITAAVNQSARGTQPSAAMRTIALGDNVIYNERIETNAVGLVQILLADGTTFTVGPNSALVIDSFVYDPAAGTAQVAATMTRGVLRFIGGATSKTPGGVTLNTPVGTVGIRGAITDINLNPPQGTPPHIDLLFGSEVTLSQGKTLLGRLYQSGYSLVFGADGSTRVVKTPPGWTSDIQQALAGKPGTSGGSPNQPSDTTVAQSDVPNENSEQSVGENSPGGEVEPLTPEEVETLLVAVATYDELRDFIVANPPEVHGTVYYGAASGVIDYSDGSSDIYHPSVTTTFSGSSSISAALAQVEIDADGNPIRGIMDVTSSTCASCRLVYQNEGANPGSATIYDLAGPGEQTIVPATGTLISHTQATLPTGTVYCACAFLHWGLWNMTATAPDANGNPTDFTVDNGIWAVGQLTTQAELDGLGVAEAEGTLATYQGHAIGTVLTNDVPSPTLTAGQIDMTWSFAQRSGTMNITNFDGRDFSGYLSNTDPYFTGGLQGGLQGDPYPTGTGLVGGGFVNDGSTPAAGVIGNFGLNDGAWSAVGTFMGQRGPDGFPPPG